MLYDEEKLEAINLVLDGKATKCLCCGKIFETSTKCFVLKMGSVREYIHEFCEHCNENC